MSLIFYRENASQKTKFSEKVCIEFTYITCLQFKQQVYLFIVYPLQEIQSCLNYSCVFLSPDLLVITQAHRHCSCCAAFCACRWFSQVRFDIVSFTEVDL